MKSISFATKATTTAYILIVLASITGCLSFTLSSSSLSPLPVSVSSYRPRLTTARKAQNGDDADTTKNIDTDTDINGNSNNNDNEDVNEFNQLKISFVTGNEMKARELNLILAEEQATKGPNPETSLVDLKIVNVDLPEIQEVNTEAIAKNKAILGAQLADGPCVVEDTSLQFNALGGMVSYQYGLNVLYYNAVKCSVDRSDMKRIECRISSNYILQIEILK
jgi:hypothetical protein